jgi:DinB superfamily
MSTDLDRIAAAREAFRDLEPLVAEREPWPLAAAFGTEPEASWGPREVLAHVEEMLPFWLGELERVVDGGAADGAGGVPFGRVADDATRIGIIGRDRDLPLRVLFGRVDAGLAAWADRLAGLTDEEGLRMGRHPRLGEMPARAILERFVLGHAEDHVAQLESILSDRVD